MTSSGEAEIMIIILVAALTGTMWITLEAGMFAGAIVYSEHSIEPIRYETQCKVLDVFVSRRDCYYNCECGPSQSGDEACKQCSYDCYDGYIVLQYARHDAPLDPAGRSVVNVVQKKIYNGRIGEVWLSDRLSERFTESESIGCSYDDAGCVYL